MVLGPDPESIITLLQEGRDGLALGSRYDLRFRKPSLIVHRIRPKPKDTPFNPNPDSTTSGSPQNPDSTRYPISRAYEDPLRNVLDSTQTGLRPHPQIPLLVPGNTPHPIVAETSGITLLRSEVSKYTVARAQTIQTSPIGSSPHNSIAINEKCLNPVIRDP